jgi:hypothetical protein
MSGLTAFVVVPLVSAGFGGSAPLVGIAVSRSRRSTGLNGREVFIECLGDV